MVAEVTRRFLDLISNDRVRSAKRAPDAVRTMIVAAGFLTAKTVLGSANLNRGPGHIRHTMHATRIVSSDLPTCSLPPINRNPATQAPKPHRNSFRNRCLRRFTPSKGRVGILLGSPVKYNRSMAFRVPGFRESCRSPLPRRQGAKPCIVTASSPMTGHDNPPSCQPARNRFPQRNRRYVSDRDTT